MAAKPDIDWHWPDEQLTEGRSAEAGLGLKEVGKYILAFADEALILLLLAYVVYRLLT